jgi:hypothetical protein
MHLKRNKLPAVSSTRWCPNYHLLLLLLLLLLPTNSADFHMY